MAEIKKVFKIMCQENILGLFFSGEKREFETSAEQSQGSFLSSGQNRESSTEGSFPPDALIHPYP